MDEINNMNSVLKDKNQTISAFSTLRKLFCLAKYIWTVPRMPSPPKSWSLTNHKHKILNVGFSLRINIFIYTWKPWELFALSRPHFLQKRLQLHNSCLLFSSIMSRLAMQWKQIRTITVIVNSKNLRTA